MSASSKTWVNNQAPSVEDDDLNGFNLENNNLIVGSGQALAPGDNQQTHKSVATYAAVGQFMTGAGAADAYTANAPAPRINPAAREIGMLLRFQAAATNTGASTLNAFGTGVDDIKLSDGTTDPAAGDIVGGKDVTVIDRGTFFELVITGVAAGSVGTAELADNAVTNAKADDMASYTIKLRNAGTTGDPQDVKISALTEEPAPEAGDWILGEIAGGQLRKYDFGSISSSVAQAWVNFDGSGVVSIRDSQNVDSITDNGTGDYTVNFSAGAFSNGNYAPTGTAGRVAGSDGIMLEVEQGSTPTASAVIFNTVSHAGTILDVDLVGAAFFGGQ